MLNIDNLQVRRDQQDLYYQLQVDTGEILAIQGKSGIGKSTLLHAIAGFVDCQQGSIQWCQQGLERLPPEQRPVSLLFQDHNLFEHLSMRENVQLGFPSPIPEKAIFQACKWLEVDELLDSKPGNCSGGQRQRMALIRTLLRPEPIVLLDEPFAELDAYTRKKACQWVHDQARQANKTLLLVTHQDEDVEQLADRRLVL